MSGSSDRSLGQRGMLDTSRMMLCMFMLAVVAFNPLGLALDGARSFSSHVSYSRGRNILSSDDRGKRCTRKKLNLFGSASHTFLSLILCGFYSSFALQLILQDGLVAAG